MEANKACTSANDLVERATRTERGADGMNVLAEMQGIVRGAAQPAVPGESVKAAIGRAARRLQLEYGRARCHWYGLVRLVPAEEADQLRTMERRLSAERLAQLRHEVSMLEAKVPAWPAAERRDG